jgi:hypothetical protein
MKSFKTQQRSLLSVVHHTLFLKQSIFLGLLAVVLIAIVIMGQAFAADDNIDLNRDLAGLNVGVLGSQYPEPFTLQLSKDGEVRGISELEPRPGYEFTERESTSLGEWRRTGPNSIELAVIQYRYGDFLCNGIESKKRDPSENCTLVVVTKATIDMDGGFHGDGAITILDRSSGEDSFELTGIPIELQKTSIDDLKAMAMDSLP